MNHWQAWGTILIITSMVSSAFINKEHASLYFSLLCLIWGTSFLFQSHKS